MQLILKMGRGGRDVLPLLWFGFMGCPIALCWLEEAPPGLPLSQQPVGVPGVDAGELRRNNSPMRLSESHEGRGQGQGSCPACRSDSAAKVASAYVNVLNSSGCCGCRPRWGTELWQSILTMGRSSLQQAAQCWADVCFWQAAEQTVSDRLLFALDMGSWKSKVLLTYQEVWIQGVSYSIKDGGE